MTQRSNEDQPEHGEGDQDDSRYGPPPPVHEAEYTVHDDKDAAESRTT